MSDQARVESIDALRYFRRALFKFAEAANVALGDAESEMVRTLMWLEGEQAQYWQSELRKRTDAVGRAKEALRMKQLFKDSSGRTPSAVDEQKALRIAQQRLEEAEQKVVAVKKYTQKLQKEILLYKGHVQRFATSAQNDVPVWAAKLDAMIAKLEQYTRLAPVETPATTAAPESIDSAGIAATGDVQSMARPEPAEPQKPPEPQREESRPPDQSGE